MPLLSILLLLHTPSKMIHGDTWLLSSFSSVHSFSSFTLPLEVEAFYGQVTKPLRSLFVPKIRWYTPWRRERLVGELLQRKIWAFNSLRAWTWIWTVTNCKLVKSYALRGFESLSILETMRYNQVNATRRIHVKAFNRARFNDRARYHEESFVHYR